MKNIESIESPIADKEFINYRNTRISHWDQVAQQMSSWNGAGGYYHRRLARVYRHLIPEGSSVLEIGCGDGQLLAALKPSRAVGIDFSAEMCRRARDLHPELEIRESDAHHYELEEKFDFVILSDLLNDVWDVQQVLEQVSQVTKPDTRIIINLYSQLWELPLRLAQKINLAKPNLLQNWLTPTDLGQMLYLTQFEVIKTWPEIIFPVWIPLVTPILNRFLARFWPFKHFSLTNLFVARPLPNLHQREESVSVSVIVPARNEAGNIRDIFQRIPDMGSGTEIIFVEGHSTDNTYNEIKKQQECFPNRKSVLLSQGGKGKGDAVRLGFQKAGGDILMILDADLTVPPEDLPRFYDALVTGKGEFINGVRLVYPMENEAMRFLNLMGNKFFSAAFSWLLNQSIKDTLCGTKVLYNKDYQKIANNRQYFGDFDPFGDFDLLFGATKLNLKIIDLPIRYRSRKYGDTNIQRFRHGLLLLKMSIFASKKIKFI